MVALSHALDCEAGAFVDALVKWVSEQVVEQGRLHIQGFGMFEVLKQMEYVWADAASRKRFLVPPRLSVRFVPAPLVEKQEVSRDKQVFHQISEMLVRQCKVDAHVAERMPVTFFKLILEGMEAGEPVEVPGWGSFLLTKVKVDDCTYGRVSFTPEEALAKWVNRPFDYFSQVELNDGVRYDDVKTVSTYGGDSDDDDLSFLIAKDVPTAVEDAPEESATTPESAPAEESNLVEATPTEESIPAEGSASEEETIPAEENVPEEESVSIPMSALAEEVPEEPAPKRMKWGRVAVGVLAALLCLWGIVKLTGGNSKEEVNVDTKEVAAEKVDSQEVVAPVGVEKADAATVAQATDTLDFAAMNAQIPYGAYDIVGVDTTITVMKGQDLAAISRIFLGTDIQIYLIVLNGGNNDPKEGDRYMIPKLKLRK